MQDADDIYKEYAQTVYKFLYSYTHNAEIAEELTQETFLRAIKSLHTYNGNCKLSVWLCQIAKHIWYQEIEKQKKRHTVPLDDSMLLNAPSVEEQTIAQSEKLEIYKKISMLAPETKEVMYLRLSGELSFKEIGEILDKTECWARVTFFRGKSKLLKGEAHEG